MRYQILVALIFAMLLSACARNEPQAIPVQVQEDQAPEQELTFLERVEVIVQDSFQHGTVVLGVDTELLWLYMVNSVRDVTDANAHQAYENFLADVHTVFSVLAALDNITEFDYVEALLDTYDILGVHSRSDIIMAIPVGDLLEINFNDVSPSGLPDLMYYFRNRLTE